MQSLEGELAPQLEESLGDYVLRQRQRVGLTQKEVATKAGIHLQSYGKLERGKTSQLNHRTRQGLAYALQIPADYLEAICRGVPVKVSKSLQFCPQCWTPGTTPEPLWMELRAKYCFLCGTELRNACVSCGQPIASLRHRFCPYCGTAYQDHLSEEGE